MKRWLYSHPNVTFLLLCLGYVVAFFWTVAMLEEERWGWFAIGVAGTLGMWANARDWWRYHL